MKKYDRHLALQAPDFVPLADHCLGIRVVDWLTPVEALLMTPSSNLPLHGLLDEEA